jgi:predicted DNA-binding protein
MDMKRTTIFLPQEQQERLAKLSAKTGAPISELIRRAIDRYLKAKGDR